MDCIRQGQALSQNQTVSLRTRQERRGCYCAGINCIRDRLQTEDQSPGQNQTQAQAHVSSVSSVYTPPPTTLFQVPYLVEETHLFWVRRVGGAMERKTVREIAEELKPGHWAYTCGGEPYFVCDGRGGRGD